MTTYILRRLLQLIPILLGVTLLIFVLFTYIGEDPAYIVLGQKASPERIAELRHLWGLDQPFWHQYGLFLRQVVTLDFGRSYFTHERIGQMFRDGAGVSFMLTIPPFVLGTFINLGIALAIVYYRGSWLERGAQVLFTATMSISYLVYIILFQYFFGFKLGWFEISGYLPGLDAISFLMLPWIIFIVVSAGPDVRLYRGILLNEVDADYVRTARAKGLRPGRIMGRHILRNAMIPVLTYTVTQVPFLILGAFLMERYFSIPGIGDLLVRSTYTSDLPILKGLTVLIAISYALLNTLTDLLYAWADPRVRLN